MVHIINFALFYSGYTLIKFELIKIARNRLNFPQNTTSEHTRTCIRSREIRPNMYSPVLINKIKMSQRPRSTHSIIVSHTLIICTRTRDPSIVPSDKMAHCSLLYIRALFTTRRGWNRKEIHKKCARTCYRRAENSRESGAFVSTGLKQNILKGSKIYLD